MDRTENMEQVRSRTQPWDIVIIGGGATGAGCALDAASRGYDVLLVEQHDFGKGTSSRSTKLVHGGVRYLRQGNLSLVRESLKERGILLRNAPHVVHKQTFIVPCYSGWQKFYYGIGLKIYDRIAGKYSFEKSRVLSRKETIEHLPTIKIDGLRGGVLYYDGRFDDTRLFIEILMAAHELGAVILKNARVTSLVKEGEKVSGVGFEDVLSGETFSVKTKTMINATGAFCDAVRTMPDGKAKPIVTLRNSLSF